LVPRDGVVGLGNEKCSKAILGFILILTPSCLYYYS
jgi:hypothetical protein